MRVVEFAITLTELAGGKTPESLIAMQYGEAPFFRITRKSIDSRQRTIVFQYQAELYDANEEIPSTVQDLNLPDVHDKMPVAIVGAGPAGLFCAVELIKLGLKPIIIERGKDVRARRRDLAAINKNHEVNSESNYCFGEGGAGTYSDGKLYTRSGKRGNIRYVLETLVALGAKEEILYDAHPHIGTNKLPDLIVRMREKIMAAGGECHFDTKMLDIELDAQNQIKALLTNQGKIPVRYVVLATGHSARDVFELFYQRNWSIEFKGFALGVRAEHPQEIIDRIQYRTSVRHDLLPPASYSLVHTEGERSAYSFCMCPGGIIAPCATAPGEIVTNGWSPSKRNNPWANSGIVVPISWNDVAEFHSFGPLAGLKFQSKIEQMCCREAGYTQTAPAQRLMDFCNNQMSTNLPDCSYQPGLKSTRLEDVLPDFVAHTLKKGLIVFGKKMKGYATNDAVLVATESRTSSPVRIPRDQITLMHPQLNGLFPCGEGAGYAGGIVSAAIDGIRVAEAIAHHSMS
jgi:uncharacterized FAD-dependent dehydrogenase